MTILTTEQVLTNIKARLRTANRDYLKCPNATNWNVQQRVAFMYQQAVYTLQSARYTHEERLALLTELSGATNGNWGNIITQHALGMTCADALKQFA